VFAFCAALGWEGPVDVVWHREVEMTERSDYCGEFDPAIEYDDFSKEFLLGALKAYAGYIRRLDGIWYLAVKEQVGDDVAFACDRLVWDKMEVNDVETTFKLFNIKANDVAAVLKSLQMSPWTWNLEHHFELKDACHGIWTVTRCPTLLALEKEGEGREKKICRQIETELLQIRARTVNPKMRAVPLKLPPREEGDDVHCQWEFVLDE
jgi:hypothetical protein